MQNQNNKYFQYLKGMSFFDTLDLFLRRCKRYDNYYSRRRLFLLIIIFCVFILYLIPLIFRKLWTNSPIFSDSNTECIHRFIRPILNEELNFDSIIDRSYESDESVKHFLPFVGNGKIAINVGKSDNSFNILGKRALDIAIPFYPIVEVDYSGADSRQANVIRLKEGIVNRFTCFDYLKKSASIKETFYAHRLIPALFVQEIKITNPSDVPLIIKLNRKGWTGGSDVKIQQMLLSIKEQKEYTLLVTQLSSTDPRGSSQVRAVAIAYSQVTETIEVNSHSQKTLLVQTFVNYTSVTSLSQIASKVPELKVSIRETAKKVLELSSDAIQRYHSEMWNTLWSSGFGISHSKAPNALNGDQINATLYYMLSQRNAFPFDNDFMSFTDSGHTVSDSKALLLSHDRCYTGHSTLQAPNLWSKLDTLTDINRIASLWLLTLEKQGCHHLMRNSQGLMQAMILSMASLEFTNNHLEFNTRPNELHRNYYIRRIIYGNQTLINITVSLADDNKAKIYVALDQSNGHKQFYACDAGCLDPPVSLSFIPREFPVKQTDPLTAILYITADEQHIKELKHTIHVKEVNEAPAHEHETVALHKYGHSLGGLPTMFWISIVFLIVIFHIFLGKLIYNEYCGASSVANVPYDRRQGRYAM